MVVATVFIDSEMLQRVQAQILKLKEELQGKLKGKMEHQLPGLEEIIKIGSLVVLVIKRKKGQMVRLTG